MVAEVIIQSNAKELNKTFDYNVPDSLENTIKIGSRVLVPFGNMKTLEDGFVIGLKQSSEYKLKDISSVQENYIDENKIMIAEWMSNRYFCNIADCLKLMLPPGKRTKILTNRIKEKKQLYVTLKKDKEEIEKDIENKKIKADKQIRVLNFLCDNEGAFVTEIEVFTDTTKAVIDNLEKKGYVEIAEKRIERNPFIHKVTTKSSKKELTVEQQNAYDKINDAMKEQLFSEFLIYGVTGSGKTEIYLQLIENCLKNDKSSIMLVPEISLTPQTVDRFIARFGEDKIAVLHSKLSIGEKYDQWNKIERGEAKIIIGPRSAIFAPVNNLGLIVIDEEHDSSYKSETTPKYSAKEVARYIARQNNICLVLGSATPDIETYFKAEKQEINLLELKNRANNSKLPDVKIVDLREEILSGNKSMISRELHNEIETNLKNKKQTILFLNRRGFSTFIMCRDCGYTVKCKNCDITLTYHLNTNKLKCHYCGFETNAVTICPECKSNNIRYFGTGTQKLEAEINKMFPTAKTIRMDVDTVSKKNSHEEILDRFKNENIDILIGTQMVVKGHHFPNVTLVGVIAADGSLNIDDFRANEKTFQILTQVAGRAGREQEKGRVIIQTYNPDNFSIECSKEQNYDLFYETEIKLRKQLKYPPFCDIITIGISSEDEKTTIETIKKLHTYLKKKIKTDNIGVILYSPLPAPIDKIKNKYRWRMIIKCKFGEDIVKFINGMLEEYNKYKKNNTKISIALNPSNMS